MIKSTLLYINILSVSSETSRKMFQKTGKPHDIMKSYCQDYGVEVVAAANRQIISPKQRILSSILYSAKEDRSYGGEPYANTEVVDHIGSGDAYVTGALFGLLKYGDHQKAPEFGNTSSAVGNAVPGDIPVSDFHDIEHLIEERQNKSLQSEMNC